MKVFSRLIASAVLALVAGFASAQPIPMMFGHDHTQMLKHLGLSDDQAKQVADIMSNEMTAAAPVRAQLKVLNAQIELAMTTSNPDLKAVNALVDKKTQLRSEMEKQFLAVAAQVHGIVGDQLYFKLSRVYLRHHRMRGSMGWNHPQRAPGAMMSPEPENHKGPLN